MLYRLFYFIIFSSFLLISCDNSSDEETKEEPIIEVPKVEEIKVIEIPVIDETKTEKKKRIYVRKNKVV